MVVGNKYSISTPDFYFDEVKCLSYNTIEGNSFVGVAYKERCIFINIDYIIYFEIIT